MFFPDNAESGLHGRIQGPEAKGAVSGGIYQFVESNGDSQPLFYKMGSVIDQFVSGSDP